MKKIIFILNCFLIISSQTLSQEKILNPELKLLIDSLFTIDQQVQQDFVEVLINRSSNDSIKLFNDRKEQTFTRHIPHLKNIIKKFGYPTFEKVGKESSSFFLH